MAKQKVEPVKLSQQEIVVEYFVNEFAKRFEVEIIGDHTEILDRSFFAGGGNYVALDSTGEDAIKTLLREFLTAIKEVKP